MSVPTVIISALLHRLHAWLTTLLLYLLSLGPMPQHVGFVMDGNRRYARGKGMKVSQGHSDGFQSLRRVLEVCLKLRIPAVTIYAFAIDNFNREEREVEALMTLAKTRLMELAQHGDLLHTYGVRIRFAGRREMFPPDVREAVEKMEKLTAGNVNGVLNVCSPYSSRDEIAHAVQDAVEEFTSGNRTSSPITTSRIFRKMETCRHVAELQSSNEAPESGKLDILVRTSNVKRLSDFMMWQASEDTQLHFVKTHWPEFGLTDMLPILLGWQQKVWRQSLSW